MTDPCSFSESLQSAIDKELEGRQQSPLATAVTNLSLRYRQGANAFMANDNDRLAYIAYRMPATYAALLRVLDELIQRMPRFHPKTLLDLGSGPGTALWAAAATFPSLANFCAIERDAALIAFGRRLIKSAPSASLQHAAWHQEDLSSSLDKSADLVIASYSIGELSKEAQQKLIHKAWEGTNKIFVIIEPGTPAGFLRIQTARQMLIDAGGSIIAPCTHSKSCPMSDGDWCHFSQRLPRSQLHRTLKGAKLGHEDEKFSYLIASKHEIQSDALGRILRRPKKHSGHMELTLCTSEGLCDKKFSRRDGESYKAANKLEWGDLL